jgi:hypothetical protein
MGQTSFLCIDETRGQPRGIQLVMAGEVWVIRGPSSNLPTFHLSRAFQAGLGFREEFERMYFHQHHRFLRLRNMAEVQRPNKTLYVRNLDESIKLPILKQDLETIFSQFGRVLNVIAHKNIKMRGQAFIVFDDQVAAQRALGSVQQFPFHGKQMEVHYAKSQSDDTVKRERSEEEFEQHKKQRLEIKGTFPLFLSLGNKC